MAAQNRCAAMEVLIVGRSGRCKRRAAAQAHRKFSFPAAAPSVGQPSHDRPGVDKHFHQPVHDLHVGVKVVDGFFVSNFVGKTPFAAVNFIMPVLMMLGSIGFMFGAGGSALVSKTMGENDGEKAQRLFSLFVYSTIVCGVIAAVISFIFLRPDFLPAQPGVPGGRRIDPACLFVVSFMLWILFIAILC